MDCCEGRLGIRLAKETLEKSISRNSQEIAGQIEGGTLHIALNLQILADDLGQRNLAYLSQLSLGELDFGILVLVPEAIALAQLAELNANDAGQCGADQASLQWTLCHGTGEQINVIDAGIDLLEAVNDFGGNLTAQIAPGAGAFQVAQSAVVVVRGDTVITSWTEKEEEEN